MDAARKEFWGDLQVDLYVQNTAFYLANQRLEQIISKEGWKTHKPILSQPTVGTYTPHSDITYGEKTATSQTLTVNTFKYAADDVDDTEKFQTPYDLVGHSSKAIRQGLLNQIEQAFLSNISQAYHSYSVSPVAISATNILDVIEQADGKLGAFDVPMDSSMKAAVFGPRTIAKLRRAKGERETPLGDSTLQNGVIGPWMGWTFVENNNLPWSGTLNIATEPTDGDTVTISGVVFTFKTTLTTVAGQVLIGGSASAARTNLVAAIAGAAGAGSTYIDLSQTDDFILRKKRYVAATTAQAMAFTGFGDISVSTTLTATADGFTNLQQKSIFMARGAIDFVLQFMTLEMKRKEKGFADLVQSMIGFGSQVFTDGAKMMVQVTQDASGF